MRSSFLRRGLSLLLSLACITSAARALTVEAESGILYKANVGTVLPGFSGTGYVTDIKEGDSSIEMAFTVPQAGNYALRLRYWAPYGEKTTRIHVNGSPRGEIVLPSSTDWVLSNTLMIPLIAGGNTVKVEGFWSWFELDAIQVDYLPPIGNQYEAEEGTLSNGTFVSTVRPGYSGGGYVTGFANDTAAVTIPVNLAQTGVHKITIRYAS